MGVLDCLDQVFNFHFLRIVLDHCFLVFERYFRFFHTLDGLQCRLHCGDTGTSSHARDAQRNRRFLRSSRRGRSGGDHEPGYRERNAEKQCPLRHVDTLRLELYHSRHAVAAALAPAESIARWASSSAQDRSARRSRAGTISSMGEFISVRFP